MNEKIVDQNDELEIDLKRVFLALYKKMWMMILAGVVCAGCAFGFTKYFVTPLYESSAMFYVNNNSVSLGETSFSISSSDITASKSLVDSYIVILKTRSTLCDVIDYSGLDLSYSEVKDMISASSVDSTEIFKITVTHEDGAVAKKIADSICYILPKRISSIIDGTSAQIVDTAVTPVSPSSPSYFKNIAVGAVLGILVSAMVIVLKEILDVTIRHEEDIQQACSYPILAVVPNMLASSDTYGYYASKKKKKKKINSKENFVGENISFMASESYKLLRTKLQFSFADEKQCYVIGVSSALAGEGKSVTSTNLAYSLAQLNKKTLIIDCDMRKPSIHTKMKLNKEPGLSNYLTRQVQLQDLIQFFKDEGSMHALSVIAAGNNPPNPVELLSSSRMASAIEQLKQIYDYIIFDLPPIGEVSDALVASKLCDGIILVARQDYGTRVALSQAVNQFEFIDAKILGVVLNFANQQSGGYKYKKYYKNG